MAQHRSPQSHSSPAPDPRPSHVAVDGAGLTAREQELLPLLEADKTNKEIAEALGISLNTVRTHTRHIRHKLRASRRGLARLIDAK